MWQRSRTYDQAWLLPCEESTRSQDKNEQTNKQILPVFWQHNLNAWVTAVLFTEWFQKFFIPKIKEYLEGGRVAIKILLIVDDAHGHPQSISIEDESVQVVFLPPNTSSCFSHSTRVSLVVSRPHTLARSLRCFE